MDINFIKLNLLQADSLEDLEKGLLWAVKTLDSQKTNYKPPTHQEMAHFSLGIVLMSSEKFITPACLYALGLISLMRQSEQRSQDGELTSAFRFNQD